MTSWGPAWGENGYIRLLRNDSDLTAVGICGIGINAVAPKGGYVLDKTDLNSYNVTTFHNNGDNTSDISDNRVHRLPFAGSIVQWLQYNWQVCKYGSR